MEADEFAWEVSRTRIKQNVTEPSKAVTVGLRPRSIHIAAEDSPHQLTCVGTVRDVQRNEDASVVSVQTRFCDSLQLLSRHHGIHRGDHVTLALDANHLHLFAGDTLDGENLLREGGM